MKTELLRMLSPDAIDIGKVGGGWAALTAQDVAAALASSSASALGQGPYYLALAVHVADPGAYIMLCNYVRGMHRVPLAAAERVGGDPIRGIIDLCLDELFGNNKCGTCGGTGVTHEQQQCAVCKGRQFKQYTDLSRARQAGIPVEYWGHFKGFYDHLYNTFSDWNSQIQTHLTRRFGE